MFIRVNVIKKIYVRGTHNNFLSLWFDKLFGSGLNKQQKDLAREELANINKPKMYVKLMKINDAYLAIGLQFS